MIYHNEPMTRAEQIANVASFNAYSDHPFLVAEDTGKKEGFILGATWADSHPHWKTTRVTDVMYGLPDVLTKYAVVTTENPTEVTCGRFHGDRWVVEGRTYTLDEIEAWTELPQLPVR